MSGESPEELSIDYLLAAKIGDRPAAAEAEQKLAGLEGEELVAALADDRAKYAFWINLYNGVVVNQPNHEIGSWAGRARFFRRDLINVAGHRLALDTIEHGILRRSRWKLGLGFVGNPFPSAFERKHRVDQRDPRIHFALNCAATSCPPIAAYSAEEIEAQLDLASRSYLTASVAVRPSRIIGPRIFLWFAGDFGGRRGIHSFLSEHGIENRGKRLGFGPFDWTPRPGRWASESDEDAS